MWEPAWKLRVLGQVQRQNREDAEELVNRRGPLDAVRPVRENRGALGDNEIPDRRCEMQLIQCSKVLCERSTGNVPYKCV